MDVCFSSLVGVGIRQGKWGEGLNFCFGCSNCEEGGALFDGIPRGIIYAPQGWFNPSEALHGARGGHKATSQPMITPLLDESSAKTGEAERTIQRPLLFVKRKKKRDKADGT